jgi:hypothetical protein
MPSPSVRLEQKPEIYRFLSETFRNACLHFLKLNFFGLPGGFEKSQVLFSAAF